MADITRRADVVWEGGLADGSGHFNVGSGVFREQPVTWASRVEAPGGKTSPEELIAAAHASCYAMAFSHTLGEAGHPPERLQVSSVVTFAPLPAGGFKVAMSELTVRGRVAGLDATRFEQLARDGEAGCPISNALRGNVEIALTAELEA
jgi:osmotically inducible protein OsmC